MSSRDTWFDRAKVVGAIALFAGGLVACDGAILDVDDPDNIEPEEELTASSVPVRFAGMIDNFREVMDDYVLYSGLLTDEFILSGTFPTRREIDFRRPTPNNTSINGDVWQPMSVSRATADAVDDEFSDAFGDPEFEGVEGELNQGIAWARLIGGYDRILFAELFCQSIFGGEADLPQFVDEEPETEPRSSEQRMQEAVTLLASAESFATDLGLDDVATAAAVGQARAHMFLGNYDQAADLVADVPDDFVLTVEYSSATPGEQNEVFQSTWGVNANIRWTVGDGTEDSRGNEMWAYLEEWLNQGMLLDSDQSDEADLEPFGTNIPLTTQTIYGSRAGTRSDAPIVLASGWEARMIEAEVALRNGSPGAAEGIVNPLLEDEEQSVNPIVLVVEDLTQDPGPSDFTDAQMGAFAPVELGDEPLEGDLIDLGRARAAGMWLSGQRQGFLRRLAVEFGDRLVEKPDGSVNLWPDKTDQNAISLTVPDDEVDNNQNIGQSCPSGLP